MIIIYNSVIHPRVHFKENQCLLGFSLNNPKWSKFVVPSFYILGRTLLSLRCVCFSVWVLLLFICLLCGWSLKYLLMWTVVCRVFLDSDLSARDMSEVILLQRLHVCLWHFRIQMSRTSIFSCLSGVFIAVIMLSHNRVFFCCCCNI